MAAPLRPSKSHWARVAQLGFWFFFIKGMLWLIVPLSVAWLGWPIDAFG